MFKGKPCSYGMNCWLLFLLIFIIMFSGCGSESGSSSTNGQANWTYMVYMAADNDLSEAAVLNINEMEQAGSSSKVHIVVQVDFPPSQSSEHPSGTLRGKITKDSDQNSISSDLQNLGNRNMTAKETLTEFITWASANYPAQHYALVLWSHGLGWKSSRYQSITRGMITDDTSAPGNHIMSLPELASAIRESDIKIDLLNFDTCLLGMYEVAYELKGLSDYSTFSEEEYPGSGDPYYNILDELITNPDMTSLMLAKTIVTEAKNYYESSNTEFTKSAIDMAQVAQLHSEICSLAQVMNDNIHTERPNIQSARDNSTTYEFPGDHDLGDFLDKLEELTDNTAIKNKIDALQSTLSSAIVSNEFHGSLPGDEILRSHGLAIYIPKSSQVSDDDLSKYSTLSCNQPSSSFTWGDFVSVLVTGDTSIPQRTASGNFSIKIQWDTKADLDLYIEEPDGNLASPSHGTHDATNGILSEDSAVSGESLEYFEAYESVEQGDYTIFVDYFYDEGSENYGPTTVSYYLMDPENGINVYTLQEQKTLDLSNPIPEDETIYTNDYSNWWWITSLTRSLISDDSLIFDRTPTHRENVNVINVVIPKKKK